MNRRKFTTASAVFGLFGHRVAGKELPIHQKLGKGALDVSLRILNLHGEQPKSIQNLFKASHPILFAEKNQTFAELMRHPEIVKRCADAGMTHLGGPMLGCISETGASVWIRTLKPASVTVEANGRMFGPVDSLEESDLTAVIRVDGLKPGSETGYRVRIDGKPIRFNGNTVIRTTSDKPGITRIAWGSCWHRWGLGHPQMDLVRKRRPSALLMIGDSAVQDRLGKTGAARFDVMLRDLTPRWTTFCSEVPVYATWDDHDYAGNDIGGLVEGKFSAEDRSNVRDLWMQTWVNPQYGFEKERSGIFFKTQIGPADVIMIDNRYFRDHRKGLNSFLGKAQMDWVKKQLLESKAPFIILSCGTMWSDYVSNGKDSWGRYDKEGREELFRFIEEHKIGGVLLISGDRHGARGFTIPRNNGFKFYEFGGACFGGRIGPPAKDPAWKTQLYGIAAEYAFSEFDIDSSKPDPEVTMRLIHESGKEIYSITLKRSELTPA
ncbi:alkaline phosphatase D family protein [Pontiella agarivorans]|uniref:Alkaline phosphatase D family protein n=1 Tax=Pontiella agarivorans TaxID=3038953 RepID=A0ABU5MTF3_9BACT|nr:alkaline phosphatase D family protein [Pontiella agarivorans]MDZ8117477.1 alkaline phosphatase D family protein [Pontiella agarivorans]